MSIAYLLLVHRYPEQFARMFQAVYSPNNHYLVHIDKSATNSCKKEIKHFLKNFPNSSLLKSQPVNWGGYSLVDVELRGIKKLLELNRIWTHYINLSGQDFPLKSQEEIALFLSKNSKKEFLLFAKQEKHRPITLNRILNYFTESSTGFVGTPFLRLFMRNTTPYIGGQWKVLTRACCEFLTKNKEVDKYKKFYKNTLIADEGFFQTVLKNTSFFGKMVNNDLREIVWIPDLSGMLVNGRKNIETTEELISSGKIKLRPKSFTIKDASLLLESKALFARKFDSSIDTEILDILESRIDAHKEKPFSDTKNIPNLIGASLLQSAAA